MVLKCCNNQPGAAAYFLLLLLQSSLFAECGWAQGPEEGFENPPQLQSGPGPGARKTLQIEPLTSDVMKGRRHLDLDVVYTDSTIRNPVSGRRDRVRLRSYSGAGISPGAPFVAPMIEVTPGQKISITLHNKLPADPNCQASGQPVNVPHCFNGTNLHSHGLWVSPTGNSDNVLLSLNPGVNFEYEYDVPPDHPSGTFWYHSHRHGSTAMQVSSGMAGALIVRGNRFPTEDTNGDIDTLLRKPDGTPMDERVLVLQQIQYACLDPSGAIKVRKAPDGSVVEWICDETDVGGIDFYEDPAGNALFGPPTWRRSGRYTTINGLVMPKFTATAGEVQRWRVIHGGVRDTVTLSFRKRVANATSPLALRAADAEEYIARNCTGPQLTYHLVASDGLTMSKVRSVRQNTLQPGYRADALLVFPEPGEYCVVNESAPPAGNVNRQPPSRQYLGSVEVAPGSSASDVKGELTKALVSSAQRNIPSNIRSRVISDLQDGLKLTKFVPHPEIRDDEVTGHQELAFFIDLSGDAAKFAVSNQLIDPKHFDPEAFRAYDPGRIDRVLKLGGVDEWKLQSGFVSHPFHIHVNPFQIIEILDPSGRDVSVEGAVDDTGGQQDSQYEGLKGVWKDTVLVKDLINNPADVPSKLASSIYTIKIRTRYQRYIGEFVLHCHILDHEDQGMMQNIRIELPDGAGEVSRGHH